MTDEEKIAGAAEMIKAELGRRGQHIAIDQATEIAKQLFNFYQQRVEIHHLPPGQVVQRLRQRYAETLEAPANCQIVDWEEPYARHPHHDQPES